MFIFVSALTYVFRSKIGIVKDEIRFFYNQYFPFTFKKYVVVSHNMR